MSSKSGMEVNAKQFRRQAKAFGHKHNIMFRTVMTDQMRLYVTDLARRFPPSKKLFGRGDLAEFEGRVGKLSARKIGERAVEIGAKSTIYAMGPEEMAFASEFGVGGLQGMGAGKVPIRRSDGTIWVVDANIYKPTASAAELEKWHNKHRSKRTGHTSREGLVNRWDRDIGRWKARRALHTRPSSLEAYIKHKKKDVGRLKGGWVAGIRKFGGKEPAKWVTRKASGMAGGVITDKGRGTLWARNTVPYASRYKRVQKFALRIRRKDLAKQAKKRLKKLVETENAVRTT